MNEPYRLRYTNQAVGVFLLIILLFLILLSVWVLRAGDYFIEKDRYWIDMPQENIRDLYKGAEVMILGERAGQIESIRYIDASDKVRVNLSIDPEMSDEIFSDSVVRQERKFGLGTPILVIRRASAADPNRKPLPSGNRLTADQGDSDRIDQVAKQVESISESIRLIQSRLDPTLVSVAAASEQLQTTLSDDAGPALEQSARAAASFYETNEQLRPKALNTLDAIASATENLETSIGRLTEEVTTTVTNDVRKTLDDVRESSASVRTAAQSIAKTSDDVNEDFAVTMEALKEASLQVQKLALQTQALVGILRDEAEQLPGTTERVNETVSDTQDLVGEIRSHWLLRRYSKQGQPSMQVSPSSVRGGSVRP